MKIAITGHRGFIGSRLFATLHERGSCVVGVDPTDVGDFDRVYHLACPTTPHRLLTDPTGVMDNIMDATRSALHICPSAQFINASSQGVVLPPNDRFHAYNVAKLAMEVYTQLANPTAISYRLPAVYGPTMNREFFIPRCVDGTAYYPTFDREYNIAHVDDVVDALINLSDVRVIRTTLSEVYQNFTSGTWTIDSKNYK